MQLWFHSCIRDRWQGGEGQDDPDFIVCRIPYAEPCEQEGWSDDVAAATYFELRPVLCLKSALELCEHIVTELSEDERQRFRRHLRPEIIGGIERRHQYTGRSIHVQDASRWGEYHHA